MRELNSGIPGPALTFLNFFQALVAAGTSVLFIQQALEFSSKRQRQQLPAAPALCTRAGQDAMETWTTQGLWNAAAAAVLAGIIAGK